MARPDPNLPLCGRQPFGCWIIAKDIEECIGQWLESLDSKYILVMKDGTLPSEMIEMEIGWEKGKDS
jgi:hypothetical protein